MLNLVLRTVLEKGMKFSSIRFVKICANHTTHNFQVKRVAYKSTNSLKKLSEKTSTHITRLKVIFRSRICTCMGIRLGKQQGDEVQVGRKQQLLRIFSLCTAGVFDSNNFFISRISDVQRNRIYGSLSPNNFLTIGLTFAKHEISLVQQTQKFQNRSTNLLLNLSRSKFCVDFEVLKQKVKSELEIRTHEANTLDIW